MTTPTRILLIDDDASHRDDVKTALAGSNLIYTLIEAHECGAGLDAARRENFDCVLLDCELANADVVALAARLAAPEGGRQAVIALTGEMESEAAMALLSAGALDSISRCEVDSHTLARAIRYAKARRGFVVELQAAKDAAEAAREDAEAKSRALARINREKATILSIIAHDLRNPFQVLLGMSRTLRDGANPATARQANGVHEAAAQAHGLLESLFSWANLHMDGRAADPSRLEVDELLQNCAQALKARADAKGVGVEILASGLGVRAQEDAAAAILRNLAGNAIKFTAAGGQVRLSAARRENGVALSVSDTGVGMSEAQTAALFSSESRATSAGTAGERGAGLGLLLCRDLTEWLGGALEVESRLGVGTTFRLVLPEAG